MHTSSWIDAMAVGAFFALAVRGRGGIGPVLRYARFGAVVSGALLAYHHGLLYCHGV
jgi:hypothetical protein